MLDYLKILYYLLFSKNNKSKIIIKDGIGNERYLKSSCSILSLLSILQEKYNFDSLFELAIKNKVFYIENDGNYSSMIHKYYIKFCNKLGLKCFKTRFLPLFIIKKILDKGYILTSLKKDNSGGHIVIIENISKDSVGIISSNHKGNTYFYSKCNMEYKKFKKYCKGYYFIVFKKVEKK